MENFFTVYFYNECDGDFGFDPGPGVVRSGLDRTTARCLTKHLRKKAKRNGTDGFMNYWYEYDWEE